MNPNVSPATTPYEVADMSYLNDKYGDRVGVNVLTVGLCRLAAEKNYQTSAPLLETATTLKVLFGTDTLTDDERTFHAICFGTDLARSIEEQDYTSAAHQASNYLLLSGERCWSDEEDYRMFQATEDTIANAIKKGCVWGLDGYYGHSLTTSLVDLRVLSGKILQDINPAVESHVARIKQHATCVRSEVYGPYPQEWLIWNKACDAAASRLLEAASISVEGQLIIQDK